MTRLTDTELTRRAIALLFNRVSGMEWHYFEVMQEKTSSRDATVFSLEKLVPEGDGYRWPSDEDPPSLINTFETLLLEFQRRPRIANEAFRRIFDMEEIPEDTGAFTGMLGELNKKERQKREAKWQKLVSAGMCSDRVSVVAEGDSWFQYPTLRVLGFRVRDVVKDIIDHLLGRDDVCLKSIAAGGDWLSNMLHSREYLPELSTLEPEAFLFSGGGNDMLGDGRAGNMVVSRRNALASLPPDSYRGKLLALRKNEASDRPGFDAARFENGLKVLSEGFFQFADLLLVQYLLFFTNIRLPLRFKRMVVVTQGYDFAIPTPGSTAPWYRLRKWVNKFAGSGKWLWVPFEKKKLSKDQKRDAAYAMVWEFNELLISIVMSGFFDYIYHVDSRGLAREDDWYDEIHLKSGSFRKVSALFALALREGLDTDGPLRRTYTIEDLPRALELWSEPLAPG